MKLMEHQRKVFSGAPTSIFQLGLLQLLLLLPLLDFNHVMGEGKDRKRDQELTIEREREREGEGEGERKKVRKEDLGVGEDDDDDGG
jgi:hypothetical protein